MPICTHFELTPLRSSGLTHSSSAAEKEPIPTNSNRSKAKKEALSSTYRALCHHLDNLLQSRPKIPKQTHQLLWAICHYCLWTHSSLLPTAAFHISSSDFAVTRTCDHQCPPHSEVFTSTLDNETPEHHPSARLERERSRPVHSTTSIDPLFTTAQIIHHPPSKASPTLWNKIFVADNSAISSRLDCGYVSCLHHFPQLEDKFHPQIIFNPSV